MLSYFAACAGHGRKKPSLSTSTLITEKAAPYQDTPSQTRQQTVDELLSLLRSADLPRSQLSAHLEDTIHTEGWWDALTAQALLAGIWEIISHDIGGISATFKEALDKAIAEARKIEELAVEFAGEHPILTTAVVAILAIGVLYLFWPVALELLGFGEAGPTAGSFAARFWQSYLGNVPKKSLFAYLQRLGMMVGK